MRTAVHRQNGLHATFESLEDRYLLAAHLLADVNSALVDIEPRNLTAVGDAVFFSAQGGLWRTDGTVDGTNLIREVEFEPWRTHEMAAVGGVLVFVGTDDEHGAEVWTSDGTTDGTQLLRDFNVGPGDGILNVLDGDTFLAVGDHLYFRTQDDAGQSLWRTDGTPDGTELVVTVDQGVSSQSMVGLNGDVYFTANQGELWKSDGTAAGTIEISTQASNFSLIELERASDQYVFFSNLESLSLQSPFDAEFGLWRTDGTEAGTQRLQSIEHMDGVTFGNRFYYPQPEAEQLWQSDGTQLGTELVTTIPHLSAVIGTLNGRILVGLDRSPDNVAAQNFGIPSPIANELWSYDAETDDLEFIADAWRYFGPSDVWELQDEVFYTKNGELWKTDGTQAGTVLVQAGVTPTKMVSLGDGIVLDNHGGQLWTSAGTPGTTEQIPLDIGLTEGSMPQPAILGVAAFQSLGSTTMFLANNQLWRTDGTEVGTQSIQTWDTFGARFIAAPFQNHVVFELDMQDENEIWISDGRPGGTRKVGNGTFFVPMLQTDDDLYFRTTNGELWRLDAGFNLVPIISLSNSGGQPTLYSEVVNNRLVMQSTSIECVESDCVWALEIRSIELGTSEVHLVARFENAEPQREERFVKLDDQLVFVAADTAHGQELWSTDGTTEGTRIWIETRPGSASQSPKNLMPLVDSVVFETADIAGNGTLWRTDGTAAGTSVIAAGFVSRSERDFRSLDDRLVFIGQDPAANTEIWLTDGTRAGTRIVDIYAGGRPSRPEFLTEMDGTVYFSADDGIHGREIWATDGTTQNTRLVQDINPGIEGSSPGIVDHTSFSFLTQFVKDPIGKNSQHAGELFFAATTETFGRELWKTNGTDEGTVMVVDFVAGKESSSPHSLTFVDDQLFLAADGDLGFEPWVHVTGTNLLPGDANGDGEVSFRDFLTLSANFGKQDQTFHDGDFDGDGSIAFEDFLLLAAHFGQRRISIGDHIAITDQAIAEL